MPLLIVQLAVLVAIAFVLGCILGRFVRRRNAPIPDRERIIIAAAHATLPADEKPEEIRPVETTEKPLEIKASPAISEEGQVEVRAVPDAEVVGEWPSLGKVSETKAEPVCDPNRPALLEAARLGKPDDLTAINGIGSAVQGLLNGLGVFHYDQIANWSHDQSRWIERNIGFPRRVEREDWIGQASKLVVAATKASPKPNERPKRTTTKSKARRTTQADH